MCQPQAGLSAAQALGMLDRALDALNAADVAALPAAAQAQALRDLERAEAKHTAARARVLAAFAGQAAYADDGQGSVRTWLRWQTRVTKGAAAGAAGWVRRLAEHPAVAAALAAGELSASWARQICCWSDQLPVGKRGDADAVLTGAARGGASLADLGELAREMWERSHSGGDDGGGDDGGGACPPSHGERGLWLGITLGGAGRLEGDLTPGCASALAALLGSLAKKAGPEDDRTAAQRRHDALAQACRRLIAAGMLPDRAGQPTQIQVFVSLAQLRALPGAAQAENAWIAARAGHPGWLTGPEADTAACDSALTTVVVGHFDTAALDRLTALFLTLHGQAGGHAPGWAGLSSQEPGGRPAAACAGAEGAEGPQAAHGGPPRPCGCLCGRCACPAPLSPQSVNRLRAALLRAAADVLSGPAGLASHLRRSLLAAGPAGAGACAGLAGPSLPLDIPLDVTASRPVIPAHLRRAVTARDPRCAFPGCDQPAAACQVHHLTPRSEGGPTALSNLVNLCAFHHLIVIHQRGWKLQLHPDGATTAHSPDGRVIPSHGPPPPPA